MSPQKPLLVLAILVLGSAGVYAAWSDWDLEPDLPPGLVGAQIDKEAFMLRRAEYIAQLRGLDAVNPVSPKLRQEAIASLEMAQRTEALTTGWTALGPAPIPNGQTVAPTSAVSGRTISIAIHPTNPNIVYVGTAGGGLYRSTDGGNNWLALMDNALSLAIGALAIAPSQPETLYVGTGEHNFSQDSFFGVGVYRIDNASSVNPTISGPFNLNGSSADIFSGRGISEIQVHPTLPGTIFVATTSGVGGLGAATFPGAPSRGIYRSTNATSAAPEFAKLTGLAANADSSVRDIVIDPLNPNFLVAGVVAVGGVGGIYVSLDALAPAPTFTQREVFTATSTNELTTEFALHHTGGPNPTVYAAVGNGGGRVLINTDGGTLWTQQVDNNFCTPQCFYDIAIEVAPDDPTRVYLGGAPSVPFAISTTSGTVFANSSAGLHVDTHVIAVSKSTPSTLYFGSDGGIWKSTNSGAAWVSLNNSGFSATQFQSLATHPLDLELMIGGTQDNGTQLKRVNGTWTRSDGGDGGFAQIDQNAADTTNVSMYHTYFNQTNAMGYSRVTQLANAESMNWSFFGCGFSGTPNGMTCAATGILFYAPMVLGPGNPNTLYFGSDVLYRSSDGGVTMVKVSQEPIINAQAITAIGISPTNDNVRVVGLRNGALFATTTGANPLVSLDAVGAGSVIPDVFVSRIVIDRANNNVAYLSLAGFPGAGQSLWKTVNLLSATPLWVPSGAGIPNIPINALVIDPNNSEMLYAGTDIGVYRSINSGLTWTAFSQGLPRVPVFDIALQGAARPGGHGPLRIATHGRGIWEIDSISLFASGFE